MSRYAGLPAARGIRGPRADLFLILVGLAMAISCVVLIEPAPIDVALIGLLGIGLLWRRLSFAAIHAVPVIIITAFLLANVVSMTDPLEKTRSIWYLMVTAYLAVSLFFFSGLTTRYGALAVKIVMNGYAVAAMLSVVLATAAYFNVIPGQATLLVNDRPRGLFKDPNVFGPFLVPVAIYALVAIQTETKRASKAIWALVFITMTLGVLLSYSRACWFNYVTSLAIYGVFFLWSSENAKQLGQRLIRAGMVALAGLLVLVALISVPTVRNMLMLRLGSRGLQYYDQKRFQTHDKALEMARRKPLGIGPGQSELALQYATHSTYLRVLIENGVLGALTFYTLLLMSLWRCYVLARTARTPVWRAYGCVLLACVGGILANSIVIDSIHWRHLWLLLGFAWTAHPDALRASIPAALGRRIQTARAW